MLLPSQCSPAQDKTKQSIAEYMKANYLTGKVLYRSLLKGKEIDLHFQPSPK